MSHPEQVGFFTAVADANRDLLAGARILEIGSYDVNGTVRQLFGGSREYVGVDLPPGPGVDRVGFGHEIDDPEASFDVAISGECFEHDPEWRRTFETMVRVTPRPRRKVRRGRCFFVMNVIEPPENGQKSPHSWYRLRASAGRGRREARKANWPQMNTDERG